jgi:hypothetical protein
MSVAGWAFDVVALIGAAAGAEVFGDSVLAICVPDESGAAAGGAELPAVCAGELSDDDALSVAAACAGGVDGGAEASGGGEDSAGGGGATGSVPPCSASALY